MTLCEFRFENLNARGSDEHLERIAALLEDLLEARWVLADAESDPAGSGWWSVCLFREEGPRPVDSAPR